MVKPKTRHDLFCPINRGRGYCNCGVVVERQTFDFAMDQISSAWSEDPPNEQADWWWWNGDPDAMPILVSIMYSGTDCTYFASVGQHGWNIAQWVKDMGGHWMKATIPKPPHTNPDKL